MEKTTPSKIIVYFFNDDNFSSLATNVKVNIAHSSKLWNMPEAMDIPAVNAIEPMNTSHLDLLSEKIK